ncbi:hypothetical protein D3C85_1373200 [compost metagenome]
MRKLACRNGCTIDRKGRIVVVGTVVDFVVPRGTTYTGTKSFLVDEIRLGEQIHAARHQAFFTKIAITIIKVGLGWPDEL